MKHKDFYSDIKHLHKEVVAEIVALMVEHDVTEVDLAGSAADHAFIVGTPDFDWDCDYMEAEVLTVNIKDGQLYLDINWDIDSEEIADENGDIGAAYSDVMANDFEKIIPCAGIDSVYESVYQVLEMGM